MCNGDLYKSDSVCWQSSALTTDFIKLHNREAYCMGMQQNARCGVWQSSGHRPLHLAWREGLSTLLILCHQCQSHKVHRDHLCLALLCNETQSHTECWTQTDTQLQYLDPAHVKMSICKNYVIFFHCQDNMEMECTCSVRRWVNSLLFTLLTSWPSCEGQVQRWVKYRQGHCLMVYRICRFLLHMHSHCYNLPAFPFPIQALQFACLQLELDWNMPTHCGGCVMQWC